MSRDQTYDAIVVGSGISGGWAAKELTQKGLKTLVLERGREVQHIKDYPDALKAPWQFKYGGHVTKEERDNYPIQSRMYNFDASSKSFFVNDKQHPYISRSPFIGFGVIKQEAGHFFGDEELID